MKVFTFLSASATVLASSATANPHPQGALFNAEAAALLAAVDHSRRSTPANQPNGYAPQKVSCPSAPPAVRSADALSSGETTWLDSRRPQTFDAMVTLLTRLNISGFDATTYFNDNIANSSALPNIGIAASGGGYRALLNGAGALAAFDNRTSNSTADGQLGGLLQSATYLAGLSGGSWLVGSLYGNNFTSVEDIIDTDSQLWNFADSILEGPSDSSGLFGELVSGVEYYDALYDEVKDKEDAGFNTTLTDFWGRALSFQLINATDGGPAYTFSSLINQTFFSSGSVPMPLIVSDVRAPGQVLIPGNTTIIEFNPYEFGSWDPTIYGFVNMQYAGTNFTDGAVATGEDCVVGFDNLGFVYGTSSTLFNEIILDFNSTITDIPDFLVNAIQGLLDDFGESDNDISSWVNPFYNWRPTYNPTSVSEQLTLVDGGENNENIPLHPLIQPYRLVDVIFAIDSSADTSDNWPNGSSLVATYERSLNATVQNGTSFPSIPDTNTFINLGLNTRPTFFGCNASNSTNAGKTPSPLIVYLPNAPYSYFSNVSTYDLEYNNSQRDAIIQNGYNVATRGNSSVADDDDFDVCVGCAILYRSLARTGTTIPEVCLSCFMSYCWNGTLNETAPAAYEPSLLLADTNATSTTTSAAGREMVPRVGLVGVLGVVAVAFLSL